MGKKQKNRRYQLFTFCVLVETTVAAAETERERNETPERVFEGLREREMVRHV